MRDLYLLVRDDQDSVRICANGSCVALASVLSEQDRVTLILPLFLELASDNSWRVRFTTVTEIGVRTAAASSLSTICKYLSVRAIVEKVLTLLTDLSNDPCEHVRVGLAGDFLSEETSID